MLCLRLCKAAAGTAVLGLPGCMHLMPNLALRVGASQRADIIASQGQPTRVWPEPGGGSTLEYATQPFGSSCWMLRLDAAGTLVEARDALAADQRASVQAGMTTQQVTRLLGRERRREFFVFSGEEVWDWTVASDGSSDLLRFNVHFKNGLVARTSHSLVQRGKGTRQG
jgi:hypothetical protein